MRYESIFGSSLGTSFFLGCGSTGSTSGHVMASFALGFI